MTDPSSYVYQVLDWDRLFENNKSRERDQLHFVCVPNKQDGMGLTRVLTHPNGAAIYGIWQLILGACSRQNRPRDGWLTDTGRAPDGHEAGTPWAPADLALRWRRPVTEIEEALRVLSAPNINWIKALPLKVPAECPDSARIVPVECLGTEREGREGNGIPPTPKRMHGIPNTVDEVIAYGRTCQPSPVNEERCRAFWAHYEGQARTSPNGELFWITSGEVVVTNWKAKLVSFRGSNYANHQQAGQQRVGASAGTTNEGRAADYAGAAERTQKRALERLQNTTGPAVGTNA